MKTLARILDSKKETRQEEIADLEAQLRTLDDNQAEVKYKIEILQREHDFLDLLNIMVWVFLRHLDEFEIRTSKQINKGVE